MTLRQRQCHTLRHPCTRTRTHPRYVPLSWLLLLGASVADAASGPGSPDASASAAANTNTISFDRNLLSGSGGSTDKLARFERNELVLPGQYSVDLYINNAAVGRADTRFAAPHRNTNARLCTSPALLSQMHLRPKLAPAAAARLADAAACVDIGELIPDAHADFDIGELRVDVSIPQASMSQLPRGYVDPDSLDSGANAGLLNYTFNSYHSRNHGINQTSAYLNLDAGLNLGRWHLRHKSILTWRSATAGQRSHHQGQTIETYVRHDLPAWRAQLTAGDTYTSGELFDSIGLRGVQIASDDRMLPGSQRGYAPIIRGVAQSNAKVTVRQNNVLLYQTTVAPGPFAISDLYPTGYGGNLHVSVTEADGQVHSFSVPYAAVAQLLRPGITRFSVASGRLRNTALSDEQIITQGTLQHGFSNLLTGYTGAVGTRGYAAVLLGGALNTHWGAMAMDITSARTELAGLETLQGHSLRLTYSKTLPRTDTSLSVAAYRHSSRGYLGINDAMLARDYARRSSGALQTGAHSGGVDHPRNRFSISLSQGFGDSTGALFLNTSSNDYWDRSQRDTQFQIGYNNRSHGIGYSLSATRSHNPFGHTENHFFVSIDIPLGTSRYAPTLRTSVSRDGEKHWQQRATLNGSAGRVNQYSYGATITHDSSEGNNSASLYGGYRNPYAVLNASAGKGNNYNQVSLGVSGAVVAHPGGITFGQPMGETVGIIVAKHAGGASVGNAAGARISSKGYALVPYLTPYSLNTVTLDPKGLPLDVQLQATSSQVAPRAGAVVMIPFKTEYGRSMIVRAHLPDGSAPPFGAQVFDAAGNMLGVVGQGGQMLVRGVKQKGHAQVRWTDTHGEKQHCGFAYTLPATKHTQAYTAVNMICTPAASPVNGGKP